MKRARKRSNTVKLSFVATVLVLVVITVIAYAFSFGIPQYSVPSNLPPYTGLMGRYGPANALQVTFDNYTAIRAVNSSAVENKQLIGLVVPAVKVYASSVLAQVLVTLVGSSPKVNNSATAAILTQQGFSNISQAFSQSNLVPDQEGPFRLYNVTNNANGRIRNEWVTLVPPDSAVLFSEGTSGAKATLTAMLNVWQGNAPSILSLKNVTRMLYAVDGTKHLALSVQNFPGQALTSSMGVVAVDVVSGMAQLSNVVRFTNATYASSQVPEVKAVYRYATDFSQYEESIKAVETFPQSSLQEAVGLAGV